MTSGATVSGWQLNKLGVQYKRTPTWALSDLTVRMSSGAVALLGPNGAGKTTLFRVLSTTLAPTKGTFSVAGEAGAERGSRERLRRRLGYLPQDFRAYGGYSTQEFVAYVAWLRRMPAQRITPAVRDALAAVGLEDKAEAKVKTLSGGMRQRLGLAQALVNSPDLLLLDEPTVGLDPEQRATFMRYLKEVSQTTSVLLATHLVEDVAAFASEVMILNRGRVAFCGSTVALCAVAPNTTPVTGPMVETAYLDVIDASRAG